MFRQYRKLEKGEFIVAGGDCSQGGEDSNCCQFYSKSRRDVPLHYHKQGVAATMTTEVIPVLEKIYDATGIKPIVGFERQNGGASEMERLRNLNRDQKYLLYVMPDVGKTEEGETVNLGYNTSESTRPTVVGDLKNLIDLKGIKVFDEETIQQLFWFIIGRNGKPQAMRGKHDDCVIALGIALQIALTTQQPLTPEQVTDIVGQFPTDDLFDEDGFYR